ncbi:hypothetical protein NH340_JMT01560 [Sarcoptes scabiei]|nr:hypothetical protein NH340_JMT01560 [Sarcoptes scabiei]
MKNQSNRFQRSSSSLSSSSSSTSSSSSSSRSPSSTTISSLSNQSVCFKRNSASSSSFKNVPLKFVLPPKLSPNLKEYRVPNSNDDILRVNCNEDSLPMHQENLYLNPTPSSMSSLIQSEPINGRFVLHNDHSTSFRSDDQKYNDLLKIATSNHRASIQSYDSSHSNSESSQKSSNSSSFYSSTSSSSSSASSFSFPNQSQSSASSSTLFFSNGLMKPHNNNVFFNAKPSEMMHHPSANMKSLKISDDLMAKAGPLTIAEMLLHGVSDIEMIHVWLKKFDMLQYEANFIQAAYDMPTISRMNPQDLAAIGITDPKDRSLFTAEIQKLKIPENIPSYRPSSLQEWLKLLNMDCYLNDLIQQGYRTIDRVTELTWEDLEDVGITKLGHQKKILLAIKKVKTLKSGSDDQINSISSNSLDQAKNHQSNFAMQNILEASNNLDHRDNHLISNDKSLSEPIYIATSSLSSSSSTSSSNNTAYQDVLIKMYANNNSVQNNSPNPIDRSQIEICNLDKKSLKKVYFDSQSPRLATFQQQQQNHQNSPTFDPIMITNQNHKSDFCFRRRSLESLNTQIDSYNRQSANVNNIISRNSMNSNVISHQSYYPQNSNCDLSNLDLMRQTICFENNKNIENSFPPMIFSNDCSRNPSGWSHRFESNVALGTLPKVWPNNRNSIDDHARRINMADSLFGNYYPLPPAPPPPLMSLGMKINNSSSDIYSTFKKKPPPPPKRVNSIRTKADSMPTTPVHSSLRSTSSPSTSINKTYLSHLNQTDRKSNNNINHACDDHFFASFVKNLTNNFTETNSSNNNDCHEMNDFFEHRSNSGSFSSNSLSKRTLANRDEFNDSFNSSSVESMYFANDNVGTIKQRFNVIQNNPNECEYNQKPISSSTQSTMSSSLERVPPLSSSMMNKSIDSGINHPSMIKKQPFKMFDNDDQANTSSQNIVDSLEHIEMMLASLKTQLDSIE